MKLSETDRREIQDRAYNAIGHAFSDGKFDLETVDNPADSQVHVIILRVKKEGRKPDA